MSFKVQVGPPQIAIHQAMTVLMTEPDGQVRWPTDKGLVLLRYKPDQRLERLRQRRAVGIARRRCGQLRRRAHLSYQPQIPHRGRRGRGTFACLRHQPRDRWRPARGPGRHQPRPAPGALQPGDRHPFGFRRHLRRQGWPHRPPRPHRHRVVGRRTSACAHSTATPTSCARFRYRSARRRRRRLMPMAGSASTWRWRRARHGIAACFTNLPTANGISRRRRHARTAHRNRATRRRSTRWQQTVLKMRTSNEEFYRLYHQAIDDMAALRLPIEGTDHMVFVPAAGLPWFMAPFGRDSLIVSLQNILIYPEFAPARWMCSAVGRRRNRTTIATPSRARSCTSCATASWRISS